MHRVVVVGSPRNEGRSALLGDELFNACIEDCPEDGVSIVSVSSVHIAGCNGCNACRAESDPYVRFDEGDPLEPCDAIAKSDAPLHRCVIDDDMNEVRKHFDAADEIIVVSPVYFSGAPSQFKALLDRLQPYFWSNARRCGKRPMILHVVGEGNDPYGFDPLISEVRSAFGVVGFRLDAVFNWVGKITEEGEIVGEPDDYPLARPAAGNRGQNIRTDSSDALMANDEDAPVRVSAHGEAGGEEAVSTAGHSDSEGSVKGRPKLSVRKEGSSRPDVKTPEGNRPKQGARKSGKTKAVGRSGKGRRGHGRG